MSKIFVKNKKLAILLLIFCLAVTFALSPLGPYALSFGVMKVYSGMEAADSFAKEKEITIDMPSGDGWYPFVMTFNGDSGFGEFIGERDRRLTILYNFPEFDLKRGCSRIFDEESPYYSSFYGAYCVSGRYGFDENGALKEKEASKVAEYDWTRLVLRDLGLPLSQQTFEWKPSDIKTVEKLAGYEDWVCVDAEMTVNGLLHEKQEFLRNYIQYGSPAYEADEDFEVVDMKGRIYGKYFEDWDCSIYFYIITGDDDVMEQCDKEIIRESSIVKR